MRIAIVEDLPADRERLREAVCRWGESRRIHIAPPELFPSGEAFLAAFSDDRFDIIFLDVYMEEMTGMDTARRIREADKSCRLVFTTTSVDFAVEGYEVGAASYLVKPLDDEKLCAALDRCGADVLERRQYVTVPDKTGQQRLYLHQIVYTEFVGRRVEVHERDGGQRTVPISQSAFAALLLEYPYFCDCMKGILVNFEAVEKLTGDSFVLAGGQRVPISRLKYREVREKFLAWSYERARKE